MLFALMVLEIFCRALAVVAFWTLAAIAGLFALILFFMALLLCMVVTAMQKAWK